MMKYRELQQAKNKAEKEGKLVRLYEECELTGLRFRVYKTKEERS